VKISKKGRRPTRKGMEEMIEQMGDTISRQTVVGKWIFLRKDGDRAQTKS
jgi:hypothetical protein